MLRSDDTGIAAKTTDNHLLDLLSLLRARGYAFVTPTPATHARVVARTQRHEAATVEDMLGWSLPYRPGACDPAIETLLDRAGVVRREGSYRRATVRVSRLNEHLFLHSAHPTDEAGSVFFGPDTYRFTDLIRAELRDRPIRSDANVVDIGTGTGAGGIAVAGTCPGLRVHVTDVNPTALRFARINARAAGVAIAAYETDTLIPVTGAIDLAMANPPYIVDPEARLYRHGGGLHGEQVSLDMATMAMRRLAPQGRMILYTGSAIVSGRDGLKAALDAAAEAHGCTMHYREIDPDVFGEELDFPAYRDVDRIALIAAIITRHS